MAMDSVTARATAKVSVTGRASAKGLVPVDSATVMALGPV
jgi:hypothetical protein